MYSILYTTSHVPILIIVIISKNESYTGIVYYEEDGVEDLVIFTAAWNLSALLEV